MIGVIVALGGSVGIAVAAGAGRRRAPITGSADRATEAALQHTDDGTVVETEVGDDGAAYGVEVRLDDRSVVGVSLDESFEAISNEADDDGAGDEDRPGDDSRYPSERVKSPIRSSGHGFLAVFDEASQHRRPVSAADHLRVHADRGQSAVLLSCVSRRPASSRPPRWRRSALPVRIEAELEVRPAVELPGEGELPEARFAATLERGLRRHAVADARMEGR